MYYIRYQKTGSFLGRVGPHKLCNDERDISYAVQRSVWKIWTWLVTFLCYLNSQHKIFKRVRKDTQMRIISSPCTKSIWALCVFYCIGDICHVLLNFFEVYYCTLDLQNKTKSLTRDELSRSHMLVVVDIVHLIIMTWAFHQNICHTIGLWSMHLKCTSPE